MHYVLGKIALVPSDIANTFQTKQHITDVYQMKLSLMEIIGLFISNRKLGFPISNGYFGTGIMSCDIKGKASKYIS